MSKWLKIWIYPYNEPFTHFPSSALSKSVNKEGDLKIKHQIIVNIQNIIVLIISSIIFSTGFLLIRIKVNKSSINPTTSFPLIRGDGETMKPLPTDKESVKCASQMLKSIWRSKPAKISGNGKKAEHISNSGRVTISKVVKPPKNGLVWLRRGNKFFTRQLAD